jgi:perosamine synthetase
MAIRVQHMISHSRPEITEEDIQAVVGALRNRHLSQGEEVAGLEAELSAMFNNAEAVAVSSGTAALYLALAALGVGAGDKVIIPSYTCNSLFSAVSFAGATALCADVGERSLNVNRAAVERIMEKSVRAVVVPHTCGYLADIAAIATLGHHVIEDCAQAAGGRHPDGTPVGGKGVISVFSFYATKLIPAGEGGACITRNRDLAETIRQLRDCDKRLPNPRAFNFKMSDINAALARRKLKALHSNLARREQIANEYDKVFKQRSFRTGASSPQAVCFRYVINGGENSEEFIRHSNTEGIMCQRPVWRPLHFSIGGNCPRTENLAKMLVSVPLYPSLTDEEIEVICKRLPELL